jgi:glycosyltransferase involved in cell wall biosynthesis
MRVAHVLRKYNPAEWGGTETALQRLFQGLQPQGVTPVIFCPRHNGSNGSDPFAADGHAIKRFRACLPVLGISKDQKLQMIAVGGNLMSFDLIYSLWRERDLNVIHSHALGRIGGIGLTVARKRGLPFVVTIHGGVLDLPAALKASFHKARSLGWDWGKIFGALLHSRQLLDQADAVLACNPREAELLQAKYPGRRIQVQPHGVDTAQFEIDCRQNARAAFPAIKGRQLLLNVARIDTVKNQHWLIERMPAILMKHPSALLVLAGACTDAEYGQKLKSRIAQLGLEQHVLLTGGLTPDAARLIGLFQEAAVVLLPSLSETFGLVLLEAWAASKPVISSRTSGASALIKHGQNGWLFDLSDPQPFHTALDKVQTNPQLAESMAAEGRHLARSQYDIRVLANRVKDLYEELIDEKAALRHPAR